MMGSSLLVIPSSRHHCKAGTDWGLPCQKSYQSPVTRSLSHVTGYQSDPGAVILWIGFLSVLALSRTSAVRGAIPNTQPDYTKSKDIAVTWSGSVTSGRYNSHNESPEL